MAVGMLVGATAIGAAAGEDFLDVPADHVFADDIQWMKDSGITKGCNPPANTQFCSEQDVTRGQMSAFFHRFALAGVVDAGTLDGKDSTEFLGVNDKAADADLLDGKDSTEFLGVDDKAADSDLLDGFDSDDFAKVGDPVGDADTIDGKDSTDFLGSTVTVRTASQGWLIVGSNETRASCEVDEVLTGGGFDAGGLSVNVTASYPDGSDWVVEGTVTVIGDVTAYAICSAVG